VFPWIIKAETHDALPESPPVNEGPAPQQQVQPDWQSLYDGVSCEIASVYHTPTGLY
jgi:hypothetical protein